MLKLISLNIEVDKHYHRVLPFLEKEEPDVICLQEAPEFFAVELQKLGFTTVFASMQMDNDGNHVGVMLASKLPFTNQINYYQNSRPQETLDHTRRDQTQSFVYIVAEINIADETYKIATTHLPDTKNGAEDEFQIHCMNNLLDLLSKEETHLICGDFNMPRGYNALYEKVCTEYRDEIPEKYNSSLDKTLHRMGNRELDQPIFDRFMVDYIFTKPPYKTKDVRLEFGISDHAGIVANIFK